MTKEMLDSAVREITATNDLLERALKLSGLITSLFQERGIHLVVVGGSAVEFYTEGNYMSGDIDFCRRGLKCVSLRMMRDVLEPLGGKCMGRNWQVCGLFIDILGVIETESVKAYRRLETPYGEVSVIPAELALVERVFYSLDSSECRPSAVQMMAAALRDSTFDWTEAERLADHADFKILPELKALKLEVENAAQR